MEPIAIVLLLSSVTALAATLLALSLTVMERRHRALAPARWGLLATEAVLMMFCFQSAGPPARASASAGLLLAALSVALAFATPAPLEHLARARDDGVDDEPSWWPKFERTFRSFVDRPQAFRPGVADRRAREFRRGGGGR
jgi:hypothetical protein